MDRDEARSAMWLYLLHWGMVMVGLYCLDQHDLSTKLIGVGLAVYAGLNMTIFAAVTSIEERLEHLQKSIESTRAESD